MKTLDQLDAKLEKRIPISSLPFTISASGSYYFTGNLQFSATTGDAITISQSNVTLDLMGFTLSSTTGVTGNAILLNNGLRNIAVKNGAIAGNTTVTVSGTSPNQTWNTTPAGFSGGINGLSTTNCQFSHLRISGCRNAALSIGDGAAVDHVTATSNGLEGIAASSGSVTNSTASSNGSNGIAITNGSVTNSTANSNALDGILAFRGSVTNSIANSNGNIGIDAGNGSITNSTANSNNITGIIATTGSVTSSATLSNGAAGIYAPNGVVAFCKAAFNNARNIGAADIDATGATRTGNNPAP